MVNKLKRNKITIIKNFFWADVCTIIATHKAGKEAR